MNQIFHGKVQKGKLILDSPTAYLKRITMLEGKPVEVVLRIHKSQRSTHQLRYYWGVIIELLAQHCGYTPEEMHESLKYLFLSDHEMDLNELVRIKSTAQLSTKEFADYIDRIVRWAAVKLEIYLPDPNQVDYQ
jgi:hypothetical protein